MNKIIFIGLAFFMLGSMGAKAQTNDEDPFNPITFVDANGNTVADGSHLRVSAAEDVWGGVQASTGLYVNNTSEDEVMTAMKVDVDSMDNGDISCCFPILSQVPLLWFLSKRNGCQNLLQATVLQKQI